jgi:hypothetical protein
MEKAMTGTNARRLPDGLVDVNRCIADALELRRQSWRDPAMRRFGICLALKFAIVGLAAVAATSLALSTRQGAVEIAGTQPFVVQSAGGSPAR